MVGKRRGCLGGVLRGSEGGVLMSGNIKWSDEGGVVVVRGADEVTTCMTHQHLAW